MAGVYAWIREGVRRAVLLGFSDAVEELGIPQDAEGVNQHLAGVLKQRTIGEPLTATARTLPHQPGIGAGRKRLGKTLEEIAAPPDNRKAG
jgi:hypothetical protein